MVYILIISGNDDIVPLTSHESVAITILEKTIHFLSCDNARVRLLTLQIYEMGFSLLQNRPIELNPLVHKVWPSVLLRCQDSRPFVSNQALRLMIVICKSSKEFVRKRIKDDVINTLMILFKKLQSRVSKIFIRSSEKNQLISSSSNRISPIMETSSSEDELLSNLFDTLKSIIRFVPVSSENANDLSEIMVRFLDCQVYTRLVYSHAIDVLVFLAQKGSSDWIGVLLWMVHGSPPNCKLIAPKSIKEIWKPQKLPDISRIINECGPFAAILLAIHDRKTV